ncbi:unnamed protein product, partial [Didymodactylos carnosus]
AFIYAPPVTTPSVVNTTLTHAIDTGNHRPLYTPQYRQSHKDQQRISDETDKLIKQGIVENSTSPWSSPIVLIKKKDGTTRFCIDYRRINEITTKDSFPSPRIDEIFDQLGEATYFTKLDFKSGYFQIPLNKADRPKTAFSTRDKHLQFTVMPQGIINGPPSFQRIINQILGPARWRYAFAYIDDIIIYSRTLKDHIIHLERVLDTLDKANFRLNVEKSEIAKEKIGFLAQHIKPGNIRPNADNIRPNANNNIVLKLKTNITNRLSVVNYPCRDFV